MSTPVVCWLVACGELVARAAASSPEADIEKGIESAGTAGKRRGEGAARLGVASAAAGTKLRLPTLLLLR